MDCPCGKFGDLVSDVLVLSCDKQTLLNALLP